MSTALSTTGKAFLDAVADEESLVLITCGHCGKPSGYSKWQRTEIFGDLPPEEYQCPKCSRAFRRQRTGDGWKPIEYVPIPSRL